MKKWILLTLLLMITIDSSAQPQDIVVHLTKNKKTTITTEELGSLKSKSGTIRNMFEDIPDEFDELHLPDVERSPFRLFMRMQGKTGGALRNGLKKLRTDKLYNLMEMANYLDAAALLDSSAEKIAQRTVSSKHLDQLLTKPGYDNYYQNLGLLEDLQGKVAQQFVKTKIALSLKKLAKQSCLTFNPDKFSWLAVFNPHQVCRFLVADTESFSGEVRTFITFMKDELRIFRTEDMLGSFAFDLKCTHFAIRSFAHKVCVFDIETKKRLRQFDDETFVASIAIDPEGKRLAVGYHDKKVCIFDIKTAEKLLELSSFEDCVNSVAFDSTGKYLVAGTCDNPYLILDEAGKKNISGKYFATIFDLKTGEKLKQFDHDYGVRSVAFDSTGNYLATCTGTLSCNKIRIRIFDVKTKEELQRFEYEGIPTPLVFGPNGNYLATESDDDKPLIWIVMPVFEKTLQKLTLPEAKVVALVAKKKIQPNAVPEHLEDLYKSLPETVRYLLEAQKQEG